MEQTRGEAAGSKVYARKRGAWREAAPGTGERWRREAVAGHRPDGGDATGWRRRIGSGHSQATQRQAGREGSGGIEMEPDVLLGIGGVTSRGCGLAPNRHAGDAAPSWAQNRCRAGFKLSSAQEKGKRRRRTPSHYCHYHASARAACSFPMRPQAAIPQSRTPLPVCSNVQAPPPPSQAVISQSCCFTSLLPTFHGARRPNTQPDENRPSASVNPSCCCPAQWAARSPFVRSATAFHRLESAGVRWPLSVFPNLEGIYTLCFAAIQGVPINLPAYRESRNCCHCVQRGMNQRGLLQATMHQPGLSHTHRQDPANRRINCFVLEERAYRRQNPLQASNHDWQWDYTPTLRAADGKAIE